MALIDGYTDTLEKILTAEAIDPELDAKGSPKAIPWKMSLDQAREGAVATATVNGWQYDVYAENFRVTATKVKEVSKTPEELVRASATVRKENTQYPGFLEKNVDAVKDSHTVAKKTGNGSDVNPKSKEPTQSERTVAAPKGLVDHKK